MHCGGKCAAVPVGPETRSSPDCLANATAPLLGALGPGPTNGATTGGYEGKRARDEGRKGKKREKEEGMTKRLTA